MRKPPMNNYRTYRLRLRPDDAGVIASVLRSAARSTTQSAKKFFRPLDETRKALVREARLLRDVAKTLSTKTPKGVKNAQ